jgi:CHAT domain-containing protein
MQSKVNLNLLAISACQSGLNASLGGDELIGLSQAFLIAGVHCLLVSLWPVDDSATAFLMTAFYNAYLDHENDSAEALRQAMAVTRERWAHPYYWAGFMLVGR